MIYKTPCSYFIDFACLKRHMLTMCLFVTPVFTFLCKISDPEKCFALWNLFLLHYVELDFWFQMIAPAHAYALYKHEKAR